MSIWQEDLSELNYSDKWPMVCEALASFLPLQQHPQAQTKVRMPPLPPCLVQSSTFPF
jgi:hypothetical protein